MALDTVCPQCGTPNPSTNRFCGSCGALLTGAGPAEPAGMSDPAPAQAPATAPQGGPDSYLPDWLREATNTAARGATTPQQPTGEQPGAQEVGPAGPELPAWLRMMDEPSVTPAEAEPPTERRPIAVQPPVTPELP